MNKHLITILNDGETFTRIKGSVVALVDSSIETSYGQTYLEDIRTEVFELTNPTHLRRLADILDSSKYYDLVK